eukprot:68423-Rhodomonas_salina.1
MIVKFDADTNLGGVGNSADCSRFWSSSTIARLGIGAECSWNDPRTLVSTLGNNAPIVPGDELLLTAQIEITTALYWAPIQQANQVVSNQRVATAELATISLFSLPMTVSDPIIVGLPEELNTGALLPLQDSLPFVSVADIEAFRIGATRYMAVAKQCSGASCHLTKVGRTVIGQHNVPSAIYTWGPDNSFQQIQTLETYGAVDVEYFSYVDGKETGGEELKHFLVFASLVGTAGFSSPPPVTMWVWDKG